MENKRKFAMVSNSKQHKKQFIGEEDMSLLLQRYTPITVLTLLREVSEVEGVKIDWQALVNKTSTGISNAREYQMLWRHLAYRNALVDRIDDASQPLDDDSDLECEVEPVPPITSEALAEGAAYVKVLMESGASNDPNGLKVEGPLIINIPKAKGQMLKAAANSNPNNNTPGMSITVPVWVQKKPASSNMNNDILDSNIVGTSGTANLSRRKPKFWTPSKDRQLMAAVHKYGEGNWANMLEFKGDRSALQLSQRWANIRKQGNLNMGNNSQLSEAQLAARHAMSMALGNRPKINTRSGIETSRMTSKSQSMPPSQLDVVSTSHVGALAMPKVRLTTERLSSKPDISPEPDSMVKAVAIAAGARIATNVQSNNAAHTHIVTGGSSLRPPTVGIGNSLPGNVHFIRTGLATEPLPSGSTTTSSQADRTLVRKTSIPLCQSSLAVNSLEPVSSGGKGKSLFKPQSSLAITSLDPASSDGKGKSLFKP